MKQEYTITVKADFGSEFQEEFLKKLLFNLNKMWTDQGKGMHSQNRLEFSVDFGNGVVAKSLGFDSFDLKCKKE